MKTLGKLSAAEMAERRQVMLQTAFRLFSERSIEAVSMADIAAETDYNLRSFQRYFHSKDALVVETAKWAMEAFTNVNRKRSPEMTGTAAETYAFFLDSFLRMYREHSDILRFNQYFNIYIKARRVDAEQMQPYSGMIDAIKARFHAVYEKGRQDGTLRTDVPEEKMFSATLHLMLAVVTRYAVGLAYDAGVDPEEELMFQRDMLLQAYTKQ
ncbi:MAG: TetR/AcrR family transcriptional regulator [Oscillospiraceae bacterium]|nr:TetR/AcrR family transcriptional regulator [Oscillospiraceae bacterium]